ncbi:ubiquitin carboxyl-terminal hydrolase 15 [Pelomyxa schiedti]|nr:ubiquitin carboxyl-terminal hydrolase 15 [Pelomyxa schiedti]
MSDHDVEAVATSTSKHKHPKHSSKGADPDLATPPSAASSSTSEHSHHSSHHEKRTHSSSHHHSRGSTRDSDSSSQNAPLPGAATTSPRGNASAMGGALTTANDVSDGAFPVSEASAVAAQAAVDAAASAAQTAAIIPKGGDHQGLEGSEHSHHSHSLKVHKRGRSRSDSQETSASSSAASSSSSDASGDETSSAVRKTKRPRNRRRRQQLRHPPPTASSNHTFSFSSDKAETTPPTIPVVPPKPKVIPPPEEQHNRVAELLETKLKVNDKWFVVTNSWFRKFRNYVKLEAQVSTPTTSSKPSKTTSSTPKTSPSNTTSATTQVESTSSESASATSSDMQPGPKNIETPGEIDNTDILHAGEILVDPKYGPRVRDGLQCDQDYVLVPSLVWELLLQWYGGSPSVPRWVIEEGGSKTLRIEVYPLFLKVMKMDKDGSPGTKSVVSCVVSKTITIQNLKSSAAKSLNVALGVDKLRIWSLQEKDQLKYLKKEDWTLERYSACSGNRFVLEVQKADGTWPHKEGGILSGIWGWTKRVLLLEDDYMSGGMKTGWSGGYSGGYISSTGFGTTWSSTSQSSSSWGSSNDTVPGKTNPGLCGLQNLGNTCFMNSAIQCLSNTALLTQYFLSDSYKKDLNTKNPLGMKGQIAEQYAKVIKLLWSGKYSSIAPRDLKWTIGKYAPQFNGFNQHDAHELVSFLLDGLHEDLNQITKRPYVEAVHGGTRPDIEVAKEAWEGHLRRDKSIIVNFFQGQLKSTLVCPDCKNVSITFDPFMYLSLPIPGEKNRKLHVITMRRGRAGTGYPSKRCYLVPKNGTIADLKTQVLGVEKIQNAVFSCVPQRMTRVTGILDETASLAELSDEDDFILAHEMPKTIPADSIIVHVLHRSPEGNFFNVLGIPFIVIIDKHSTGEQLYRKVWHIAKKYTIPMNPKAGVPRDPAFSDSDFSDPPQSSETESSESDDGGDKASHAEDRNKEGSHKDHHRREKGSTPKHSEGSHREESSHGSTRDHHRESRETSPTHKPNSRKRYPFWLSYVRVSGTLCSLCEYAEGCTGCRVGRSEHPAKSFPSQMLKAVAVDWKDLTVVQDNLLQVKSYADPTTPSSTVQRSITDCFSAFTVKEQLGPEDPWYCPTCKDHKQASKQLEIWKLPEILVIHFKRFAYTKLFRQKLMDDIAFPIDNFDLTHLVPPQEFKPVYELYAVSNHSGGIGGGHYTANCRNKDDNNWYNFNDSSCSITTSDSVSGPAAYLLFYQLKKEGGPLSESGATTDPSSANTALPPTSSRDNTDSTPQTADTTTPQQTESSSQTSTESSPKPATESSPKPSTEKPPKEKPSKGHKHKDSH